MSRSNNPTGKGGFRDHPELINRTGLNRRDPQDWQATIKRITNMTREEAIELVGRRSKMARLLRELPPELPIKDALVLISIIQYGRDPNPRMFQVLTDREDGKPRQSLDVTSGGEKITEIGVKLIDYRTGITATETGSDIDSVPPGKDENTGNGA